jgi:hypothetical protein
MFKKLCSMARERWAVSEHAIEWIAMGLGIGART